MRIVVTGGSGKIGAYVVRELVAHNHRIVSADTVRPKEPVDGATFVQVDTTDMGQVVGALTFRGEVADAVIHLAAIPNVWPQNSSPPSAVWRVNALGVYHVAEACASLGITKFVEASSINVHQFGLTKGAVAPPRWPIDETMPYFTMNAYGLSKVTGEQTARMLHNRTGAQAISIRPALVLFPETYGALIARMKARETGWLTFAYSDVRDLAVAFRLAVEKNDLGCEALYVVNDDPFFDEPIIPILRKNYRDGRDREFAMKDGASDVTNAKAKRVLGWKPEHNWRDEDTERGA